MIPEPAADPQPTDTRVASLIASRICHDLISPIGAIGNGLELLTLSAKGAPPELDLIGESVSRAQARIRFFRIAFGEYSADQRIGAAEIRSILEALVAGTRIAVDWQIGADLPRREAKLCFLLLLCLETALARGGTVTVREHGQGWRLLARAEKLRIDPALWDVLRTGHPDIELSPNVVQFVLGARHAQALGGRTEIAVNNDSIAITYSPA